MPELLGRLDLRDLLDQREPMARGVRPVDLARKDRRVCLDCRGRKGLQAPMALKAPRGRLDQLDKLDLPARRGLRDRSGL